MWKKWSGVCLSLALAACVAGCGGGDKVDTDLIHNPSSASGYDESAKMPAISFDKEQHDFGRLTQGENVSYSFKFTNTGKADLIIYGCSATCGCTVADYPHDRIKPGQSDYVKVSFNSTAKHGQQFQEVTVSTNAQPSSVKLKILALVN